MFPKLQGRLKVFLSMSSCPVQVPCEGDVQVFLWLQSWQQSDGKWWGLFVYFLLHRAQGPCGCPVIISLSTGEEKCKHNSCIQNSCMLVSRIFFLLVLDKFLFPLSRKVFLSYLTLSL